MRRSSRRQQWRPPRCRRRSWKDLMRLLSVAAYLFAGLASAAVDTLDSSRVSPFASAKDDLFPLQNNLDHDVGVTVDRGFGSVIHGTSGSVSDFERQPMNVDTESDFDPVLDYEQGFGIDSFINIDTFGVHVDPPDCSDMSKTGHRLECWLWNLQVMIPDQSFRKDFFSISIRDMMCTNFGIASLDTTYQHSSVESLPQLSIDVSGISATCKGRYKSGVVSGNVEATVSSDKDGMVLGIGVSSLVWNGTDLKDDVEDVPPGIYVPSSIRTGDCKTNIVVPPGGIRFSGSASAKIIDLFSKPIGKYISSAIADQVCPAVTSNLDPTANEYLKQADQWIVSILKEIPTSQPSRKAHLDWEQIAIGKSLAPRDNGLLIFPEQSTRLRRRIKQASDLAAIIIAPKGQAPGYLTQLPVIYTLAAIVNQLIRDNLNRSIFFEHWLPAPCDETDCGYFFRGIAGMMESYFDGTIKIKMPKMFQNMTYTLPWDSKVTLTLSIDRVIISGLQNIQNLHVADVVNISSTMSTNSSTLRPDGDDNDDDDFTNSSTSRGRPKAFLNSINASQWNISTHMDFRIDAQPGASTFHGQPLEESFRLVWNIDSIEAIANTLIKVHGWDDLTVLQVIYAVRDIITGPPSKRKSAIKCIVATFQKVELLPTDLLAKILFDSMLIIPEKENSALILLARLSSLEDDLDNLVNTIAQLTMKEYQLLMTSLTQGAAIGPGRRALNKFVSDIIHQWGGGNNHDDVTFDDGICPPDAAPSVEPRWVNFTSLQFLNTMNRYLNNPKSLKSLNHYIDCVSRIVLNHQNVYMQYTGGENDINNEDNSTFGVVVRDVKLEFLDAIGEIKILSPSPSSTGDFDDDTFLLTSASWGHQPGRIPQVFVSLDISYPMLNTHGIVNFTAFVGGVDLLLGTRLNYDLNRLSNISIADLLTRGQCAFVPSSELRLLPNRSNFTIAHAGVNISASLFRNGDSINITATTDDYPVVQEFLSSITHWSFGATRQAANKVVEKLVEQAANICRDKLPSEKDNEDDEESGEQDPLFYIIAILFVVGQAGVLIVVKISGERNHGDYIEMDDEGRGLLSDLDGNEAHLNGSVEPPIDGATSEPMPGVMNAPIDLDEVSHCQATAKTPSLFYSPEIPETIRHLIPIAIVGTIFLLLSGNLTTGASVDLKISIGGNYQVAVPSVFTFSFGHTVQQMYQAGIYPLLFLVVAFSGIWPYGKLFLMLHTWMLPVTYTRKREHLLLTLDALGKFSLVDTYVLVVMLVSFRCHLELSKGSGLDVYVTPQQGFYGFLIATSSSLVIGHAMVYYHRRTQNPPLHNSIAQESLCGHFYEVNNDGSRAQLSFVFQLFLFACAMAAAVFLSIGFNKESFIFEIGGLAGVLLRDESRHAYSLISIGASLSKSVEYPFSFGILFLQIAFFFYAVVTPLVCLISLMTLLIYPMTLSTQRKVLVVAEIANAWSAVEVFALSIIAALLQISTFASFFVGHSCDIINRILEEYFPDQFPDNEAVCYTVKSTVSGNCWYLVTGVLLNSFAVSVLLRVAHCAIDERIDRSAIDRRPPESDGTTTSTIATALYNTSIRSLFFSGITVQESDGAEQNGEETAEQEPAWRHWF